MDPVRLTLEQLRELGTDIAPQAARRSRASVQRRFGRLRLRAFFIVQCALAAGVAWALAHYGLRHPVPFFAPVAAIVCLGFSFGQRLRRVAEVMVGVAVGVAVGDLFVHVFGTGPVQIAVVVALSMGVAVLVGAGILLVTQAGIQAATVVALLPNPGAGFSRWIDAALGGLVAMAAATIAPAAPIRRPREQATEVLNEIAGILDDTAAALRRHDSDAVTAALRRARASESSLDELSTAASEGIAVVQQSPFRRRHRGRIQQVVDLVIPLDRAIRNVRVLVRRAAVSIWRDERVPDEYAQLLGRLADGATLIGECLFDPAAREGAKRVLGDLGRRTAVLPAPPSLSAVVMLGQIRSTIVDLLELTGVTYDEARTLVPLRPDGLAEG
jgi:uncharacterized membrane protein YgaE (UPF0421/DUF939 family)